jgi:hypothetical protein
MIHVRVDAMTLIIASLLYLEYQIYLKGLPTNSLAQLNEDVK